MKPTPFGLALLAMLSPSIAGARQSAKPCDDKAQNLSASCPSHDHSKMNERGQKGMGFSQTATTHISF